MEQKRSKKQKQKMSSKPDTISIHQALDSTAKKSATTLSEFLWKLKESKTEYHLSWDVFERAQPYSAATNRCNLCIAEKYFFLKTKPSLNTRREIFSSCPHRKKHLLQNYHWPGNENKQQHKVGTTTEHTSVIPEESGGQATPLSSA